MILLNLAWYSTSTVWLWKKTLSCLYNSTSIFNITCFFFFFFFLAISSLSSLPDRDSRTVVTLLEGQVVTLTAVSYMRIIVDRIFGEFIIYTLVFFQKTDELQSALLQEREARVQLESQLQQFTDRLSPLMISPAPWY